MDALNSESKYSRPQYAQSRPQNKRKRKRVQSATSADEANLCAPWLSTLSITEFSSIHQKLHHEIVAYVNWAKPLEQERIARTMVFECIERIVQRRFWDAKVKTFGSSSTGLALPNADLDLAIISNKLSNPDEMKKFLYQLSAAFRNAGITTFEKTRVIHRAKVPIVGFTTESYFGRFEVDIGINNTDGVEGAAVINSYIDQFPPLKPLILCIKGMLKQRGMNDAANEGLGSYSITLMCISFLQINPFNSPREDISRPYENESLGMLLVDFLLYYGSDFPYSRFFISVRQGKLLPKEDQDWISDRELDGLVIQCVINPERNVSKSLKRLDKLRAIFRDAASAIVSHGSLLETSPLSAVVMVDRKVIGRRWDIVDLVDSRELDREIEAIGFGPKRQSQRSIPSYNSTRHNDSRDNNSRHRRYDDRSPHSSSQSGPSSLAQRISSTDRERTGGERSTARSDGRYYGRRP